MCVVLVEVPEEILLDMNTDKNEFSDYVKQMVALDLYKNKSISLGYCAQMADMTKEEFMQLLGQNAVTVFGFENEEEFVEEMKNA